MSIKGVPKYKKIVLELEALIHNGKFPVGGKLPSVVKLCEKYGVSTITAHRSIRELENKGLVKCGKGLQGTTVISIQPPETNEPETIACLLRPFTADYSQQYGKHYMGPSIAIQTILDTISENKCRSIFHSVKEADYESNMLNLIHKNWISGVILDQMTPPSTVKKLTACGKPSVLVGRVQIEENLSVVAPDIGGMCRKMAVFLKDKGYERVGFHPDPDDELILDSIKYYPEHYEEHFRDALATAGIESNRYIKIPEIYHGKKPLRERIMETCGLPKKKPADWTPFAIFTISINLARELTEIIASTDLVLGKDIGVITCFPAFADNRISYWTYDSKELGIETAHAIIQRIRRPKLPPTILKLPVTYVDNGSA